MASSPCNCAVVLVEPQGPRNVGSVCRVMHNFEFDDLRLVAPVCDHLGEEARHMAVRSGHLLEEARVFSTLAEAIGDCQLVFGTTRRFGKYRDDFLYPESVAPLVMEAAGRAALVFGREDNGLTTAELHLCHHFVTIPTSDRLPSMNLAQAVAVCLYQLHRQGRQAPPACRRTLAPVHECEAMLDHMQSVLTDIGYLNPQNPDHIMRAWRRIFGRAGLSPRDVRILRGLWSAVEGMISRQRI